MAAKDEAPFRGDGTGTENAGGRVGCLRREEELTVRSGA
jgi:hypothetical protein